MSLLCWCLSQRWDGELGLGEPGLGPGQPFEGSTEPFRVTSHTRARALSLLPHRALITFCFHILPCETRDATRNAACVQQGSDRCWGPPAQLLVPITAPSSPELALELWRWCQEGDKAGDTQECVCTRENSSKLCGQPRDCTLGKDKTLDLIWGPAHLPHPVFPT